MFEVTMNWPHSRNEILRYFQNWIVFRKRRPTEKIEKPDICLSKREKKN